MRERCSIYRGTISDQKGSFSRLRYLNYDLLAQLIEMDSRLKSQDREAVLEVEKLKRMVAEMEKKMEVLVIKLATEKSHGHGACRSTDKFYFEVMPRRLLLQRAPSSFPKGPYWDPSTSIFWR